MGIAKRPRKSEIATGLGVEEAHLLMPFYVATGAQGPGLDVRLRLKACAWML